MLIRSESQKVALKLYSAIPHDPPGRQGITEVSQLTAAIWCWLAGSRRNLKTTPLPSSAACAQQCLGGRDNQEPFSCFSNVENAVSQGIYQLEFIQSVAKMYWWMQSNLRAEQAISHDYSDLKNKQTN